MHHLHRAGAIALATLLLAACGAAPGPDAAISSASPAANASADAQVADDADALRERARQAMQASRMFAPAGDNALEHYLALRAQAADDASVRAALVDLQPQLVIAIEQAIARGEYPESRRLLDLLARADTQAPALPRLRETVASAETAARDRELAVDAETRAEAERAEAELRRVAQENATRLATERGNAPVRPSQPSATGNPAPSQPTATSVVPAADAPARTVATPPARPVEAPRPAPPPVQQVAASMPAPSPAKLLRDVAPRYPEGALRQRQSGQVQVAFTINAQGGVESPRVVSSDLPTAFDRAALAAASRWKFEATGGSQPGSRTVRFDPPGG
ncbi:TonB family protein [Thermomonas carbonis]|uniref:TonB family protein n=1 Tax=Thermomonas carbonis TaxID=1463158 RepID=A0A7G9STL9_9GAMM|nr:TonB family protein [Thermomonas carbonis]QNN71194.1 TonB family protein [Thermomonas carbonis]GHC11317.1 cell envelope biogenesis protein TonB [Thermomonas carbonis]